MVRLILALLAGLAAGVVTVGLVEAAGHALFPPPPGLNPADPARIAEVMDEIPLGAKIAVIVAWAAGIFLGGFIAAFLARRGAWPAWAIAAVFLCFAGWTMMTIPHPPWMVVAALVVTLAFGWLAGKVGARTAR